MFDRCMLNRLFRYCRMLCDQESDAMDLLQNSVEKCLKAPPGTEAAAYSYAIRVIRNAFIDERRKNKHREEELFDESLHTVDYDISGLEQLVIERSELEKIWSTLSVSEREIMFLWAVEGYSTSEIASHQERSRNSILSIIHRMRKRLHEEGYIDQTMWEVA